MLYSSGTTGRPKGITTSAIESDATLEETPSILTQILIAIGMNADTVYLSPAPLYHAAPLRFTMGVHQLGGHCIVMEKWDAALALELIERDRVTAAQFVPTMFIRMLRLPEDVRAGGRRVVAASSRSTPRRRARSRSSARCSTGGAR